MWHEARKQEKLIKSMMVDYRKRAERRRDYYEKTVSREAQTHYYCADLFFFSLFYLVKKTKNKLVLKFDLCLERRSGSVPADPRQAAEGAHGSCDCSCC